MKILTLVLSCRKPPYDALENAQRHTWDSVAMPGVDVAYYWCDDFQHTYPILRHVLWEALDAEWDLLFRTNASSYIDKNRLLAHAAGLPRERCYQGVDGGDFASGSGFFLSRDCVHILLRALNRAEDFDLPGEQDDVLVGRALARAGVSNLPGAKRVDYWADFDETAVREAYHVRCKHPGGDRMLDAEAMEIVYKIKAEAK